MRTLAQFRTRIREELRAEGTDGAGYSDVFLKDALNSAQDDLAALFTFRDTATFTTSEDTYTYDLKTKITDITIENIIRISHDGDILAGIPLDSYLAKDDPEDGDVEQWTLWGNNLTLIGEVEDEKTVKLWVTRAPTELSLDANKSELPYYAQEAMIQYAISACYRESRDYERAGFHFSFYQREYNDVRNRVISQGQRDHLPTMRDSYTGPISQRDGVARSDTNPGGRTD